MNDSSDADTTPGGRVTRTNSSGEVDPADQEEIRDALRAYATEFLLLLRPDGRLVASSEVSTLGYGNSERVGHHIAEHLHPDDLLAVFDLIERARATKGFRETIRVRASSKEGDWGWFEAEVIDATRDPNLRGAVLRVRNITDEMTTEIGTIPGGSGDDHQRFLSLAEALPLGILSADARGCVVFCNKRATQIFDRPEEGLVDRGWERAIHGEDLGDVLNAAGQVIASGVPHQATFRVETGAFQRWAHIKFVPLGTRATRSGWIATVEDVTDRRRAESRLAHQATHDPLTNLPNRTLLEDRLRQACSRIQRQEHTVTVLFADLDSFKEVNDNFGHSTGDEVLREVSRRLSTVVRDVDTVARLGGDEFIVLCEGLVDGEVEAIVERIHEALRVPILAEGNRLSVGASVGVARSSDAIFDAAELLNRADQDMYREKESRFSA